MRDLILEALKLGLWRQLDVQFAYMLLDSANLYQQQNALMLAVTTLSAYVNQGNVCLPLIMLTPDRLFGGAHLVLANKA